MPKVMRRKETKGSLSVPIEGAGSVPLDSSSAFACESAEYRNGELRLRFEDAEGFEAWLAGQAEGRAIWLMVARKGAPTPHLTYDVALDVALCYGWIDSVKHKWDAQYSLQRFGPRRPRSVWSQVNCARAERLLAAGRMRPPGAVEVERARADGRWDAAYAPPSRMELPPWFEQRLRADATAHATFLAWPRADQYAVAFRLATPRREATRLRHAEALFALLAAGKRLR